MIEKLDRHIKTEENGVRISCPPTQADCIDKINELVDTINSIQKEREAERFEIQEWIGIIEAVRKSVNKHRKLIDTLVEENNIHEEQIDELQMKVEPEKCETSSENVQDPTKWLGKLCKFWDDNYKITKHFGILTRIDETAIVPYEAENGFWYCACEPINPTDSIIYKGE